VCEGEVYQLVKGVFTSRENMIPSLVSLDTDPKRSNAGGSNAPTDKELFELLSDEVKDLVLEQAAQSSDCENMGKWCSLMRCDESVWQRGCVTKGWNDKPQHFSWRIWYARKCKPDWAKQMDEHLIVMSKNGDLDKVRLLLDRGADIHAHDDRALHWASEEGHLDVVRLLLDRGADIHTQDDFALRWASFYGRLDVVRFLLDRGANIHAKDDFALRYASEYGHLEIVRLLLDRGANVHARNNDALRNASGRGHLKIVRLLRKYGA